MPWKIIILLANDVGDPIQVMQMHLMGNDFVYTKMSFFDNFVKKNLTAAGVFRRNIWFSLPIPKIRSKLTFSLCYLLDREGQ